MKKTKMSKSYKEMNINELIDEIANARIKHYQEYEHVQMSLFGGE